MSKPGSQSEELQELHARLHEAEETIAAIRHGEVDALVVSGPAGENVYTLQGADFASRVLLQEMNEGALTLLPDGPILYCNKCFASLVKLPHEQIIGMEADRFIAPADRAAFAMLVRQALGGGVKGEIDIAAADGTVVPTYCSVNPVQLEDKQCVCVIVTDLTEPKRNEAILASGALARSILEQAGEIIVVCDDTGHIIEASRAAHEFCGRNILRERFEDSFRIDAADGVALDCDDSRPAHLKECFVGGKSRGVEVRLRRQDGTERYFLMSASPLHDVRGNVTACVFTLSDISKIKEAEEALRADEQRAREQAQELEQQLIASGRLVSLGEITASMAHEFNNPLGIIMGFVEDILNETDPNHPQYRALQIVAEESKRCQKIIRELMEFARPVNTSPRFTEIGGLIEKTLEMIDARLYKQKVALTKAIAPDLPPVHVDSQQLEQVLVNMYLNALDAMIGGGTLTVSASVERGNPAPAITISIADTGMGIDLSDLRKIFQPFFTARKKAGLGLGLSISERIVKNHGGTIEVESELGHGTVFRVRLPIDRHENDPVHGGNPRVSKTV